MGTNGTRTPLERLVEALIQEPSLVAHVDWLIDNAPPDAVRSLYRISEWLSYEELEKLLLLLDVYQETIGKPPRFTELEKRLLIAARCGVNYGMLARELDTTQRAIEKAAERLRRKYHAGFRISGAQKTLVLINNHPHARLSERLTASEHLALRMIASGKTDRRIASKLGCDDVAGIFREIDRKSGFQLCAFIRSGLFQEAAR